MIDKRKVICDKCDEIIRLTNDDFYDRIEELKNMSWENIKEKDEWKQYCPTCRMTKHGFSRDVLDYI